MPDKKFPLIPIEGGYIIIDESFPTRGYDGYVYDMEGNILKYRDGYYKIIAHTGIPSLKDSGLPTFDLKDRHFYMSEAKKVLNPRFYESIQGGEIHCFEEGYKAAGGYSEEDMRNAWYQGILNQMKYEDNEPCLTIDQFIESLKKHPKYVVLEMVEKTGGASTYVNRAIKRIDPELVLTQPKITAGKVVVKEVIYE